MSSQYEEDKIVADFFGDYVGTFLDLGAGDGRLCSNTEELVKRGWSGVCVEPHAESFSALRKFYRGNSRVQLVQSAVSSDGRLLKFFHHYEQLSTALEYLALSDEWYWVPSISSESLERFAPRFDFVSVDCEGMDQEIILAGRKFLRSTTLLCYETDLPRNGWNSDYSEAWCSILGDLGFTVAVGKTEGNTLVTRP